jgi:hypothetical protein
MQVGHGHGIIRRRTHRISEMRFRSFLYHAASDLFSLALILVIVALAVWFLSPLIEYFCYASFHELP